MLENLKSLYKALKDTQSEPKLSDLDLDLLDVPEDARALFAALPADALFRVRHMASLYGLEFEDLADDPAELRDQVLICGNCNVRGHCGRQLRQGRMQDIENTQFCPNAISFSHLMYEYAV